MGSLFRSEEMSLCQMFLQPESAYLTISEIGETGVVQFRDLNVNLSSFQRKYVNEVRRCEEMERKLRYITEEVNKDNIIIMDLFGLPRAPLPREMINLEAQIEKTESDISELTQNAKNLQRSVLDLIELRIMLEAADVFFAEEDTTTATRALMTDDKKDASGCLDFIAGVMHRERMAAFERMMWRVSHGNIFLRQTDISERLKDHATGDDVYKTVFVAFFQGEELKTRIKKLCSGLQHCLSLYPCPSNHMKRLEIISGVSTRIEDLKIVLNQTQEHRLRVLQNVAKQLPGWSIAVNKIKAIYHTMNLFNVDVSSKCLIGECWIPKSDLAKVQTCLNVGSRESGSAIESIFNTIETEEKPPTFYKTNKYTKGFQILIDAYGVASYREANPALYTIVTFPFLFSIMFGDAGHGLLLFLFGLFMVLKENELSMKKSNNEIWNIFFGGRYIILLMGLFSMYTGIIYNDVFSRSLNIFSSSWNVSSYNVEDVVSHKSISLDPKISYADHPYPVGMDPVWMLASNKIVHLNSYKMKLSIIFGVVHMIFGVSMSVVNIVHFKKYSSLFFEFLPQLLFLLVLFAYLVSLMFLKWVMYSGYRKGTYSEACAPSILIIFINMMLFGENKKKENCEEWMFEGQDILQKFLVAIALVCIPIMLLGKPLYTLYRRRQFSNNQHKNDGESEDIAMDELNANLAASPSTTQLIERSSKHKDDSASELFIYQAIHTIEYVLSTVSHTASYLRLWALSLAHSQLSEILWIKILHYGFIFPLPFYINGFILSILFAAWAFFTLAILVLMEGLSAFLHTLRLHWVEFLSKFYDGQGYPFQPFSFKASDHDDDDEENSSNH
ncbi:V-type proton ATPase 116 kDa subunit a-like isoform X1 [Trichogramma pretiosum]|uniref:V-type proton ATPase 116 kDa subunit a-like isoform X1 n=2 Tax=Trichogramma pretiosum TaxID=7493 RepID=UPI0006C96D45|nr:V-type proton ATPase 116 kDa subunit a-like isoform X1 [Trichogramma pretiosum]XP_023314412.1 V-type proton ATPase 116 kDa subunit a-like isoform X1 [Trichogramma pretiosum]